jgi:N-acetylglutamate synthase-like GNAT family acetyltransferase
MTGIKDWDPLMIVIKSPTTREEFKEYYTLRYEVLRKPWGQPKGTEKDDYEPISDHFMAVDDLTGGIVGVVKLDEKEPGVGWLSHLAVALAYQNKGVGTMLVKAVEQAAVKKGYKVLGCNARLNAAAYFERFGFEIVGLPTHYFATVQVAWMEKQLSKV